MTVPLKTRILLADDHAVVRRGLRMVLDAEPDLEVVAEVGDGAEAVEQALRDDLHLAILDVTMPRLTGIQAARQLSRRKPELRVLILSMHDNERYFFEALRAGASDYVLKSAADRDLVDACRATMRGELFYPEAVTALIRDYLERRVRRSQSADRLRRSSGALNAPVKGRPLRAASLLDAGGRWVSSDRRPLAKQRDSAAAFRAPTGTNSTATAAGGEENVPLRTGAIALWARKAGVARCCARRRVRREGAFEQAPSAVRCGLPLPRRFQP